MPIPSNSLLLIIQREYRERVQRKSFIISTLMIPLFMLAVTLLPSLIMTEPAATAVELHEVTVEESLGSALALIFTLVLYLSIMLYGQLVMNSVIEEKSSRVLEIMVMSVKPRTLMLGKILGVCAVALTQLAIWLVLAAAACIWLVPSGELELLLGQIGTANMAMMLGCMLLFLVGGLLFYASIYAALGSAADNPQDATQLSFVAVLPIVAALMIGIEATGNPHSTLAVTCSYIPFTAPIVMMARLPFGVDWWQVALSMATLALSFAATLHLTAKIYRVGIFVHGTKASFKDMLRWMKES